MELGVELVYDKKPVSPPCLWSLAEAGLRARARTPKTESRSFARFQG